MLLFLTATILILNDRIYIKIYKIFDKIMVGIIKEILFSDIVTKWLNEYEQCDENVPDATVYRLKEELKIIYKIARKEKRWSFLHLLHKVIKDANEEYPNDKAPKELLTVFEK